jgi:hypothetical protein
MRLLIRYSCIEYTSQWKGIKFQANAGENIPRKQKTTYLQYETEKLYSIQLN